MKDVNLLTNNGVDIKKSLELFGDMDTYNDMLDEFLDGVDEKLNKLKNYKEVADMGNYAIAVHSLKSDAKYFGFTKLAELAYDHEMKSKANDLYYVCDHYDELMSEAKRILSVAYQYAGKESKISVDVDSTPDLSESIIVVDDSDIMQKFISKIFKGQYNVIIAKDGEEALRSIVDNPNIKGMLLDLNMPHVDGFAVLKFLDSHGMLAKIPVTVITGVENDDVIARLDDYKIAGMLKKPFNERDIKNAVENMIVK